MSSAVLLSPDELAAAVRDARERTFELAADLTDEQWMGPRLAIVNPLGWVMLALAGFLLFIGNLIIRRLTAIA